MNWFSNLKTLWKLLLGFSAVCAVLTVVGVVGIVKMAEINDMLRLMYEKQLICTVSAAEAGGGVAVIGRSVRDIVRTEDQAERLRLKAAIDERAKEVYSRLDTIESWTTTERGKQQNAASRLLLDQFMEDAHHLIEDAIAGERAEAEEHLADLARLGDEADKAFRDTVERRKELSKAFADEGAATYRHASVTLIAAIVVGVTMALGGGISIARAIALPLRQAVEVLRSVAAGDFTASLDVRTKDEVGELASALNEAVDRIRGALTDVRSVAEELASSSRQLASSSQTISAGAQEQASSLEETASSLEEIASTIRQNAENATVADRLSGEARGVAEKGGVVVAQAVTGMKEINVASARIADIIVAIDEIAFQTNLLALNAAVEAARAGEQGRGFAVVAGEVRNLAQRSAGAAKEIKSLIGDSVQKIESGSALVDQSGQALERIVASVKRVTEVVGQITTASREQASGIDQVNKAVSQMDQVTQANASQTEELSSAAEGLSAQADRLQALVAQFILAEFQEKKRPARTNFEASRSRPASAARPAEQRSSRSDRSSRPRALAAARLANGWDAEDEACVDSAN